MNRALLNVERLSVVVAAIEVCRDLSFEVRAGECWGILGRNGVGKTTLLQTLAGLRQPLSGRVQLCGKDLARLRRREVARHLGLMFQTLGDPFPLTVQEIVLLGRYPHLGFWRWEDEADLARAEQALRATELSGLSSRRASTLSGGERQRLAFATLLAQDPRLFLLDEPVNHLDIRHQVMLLSSLQHQLRGSAKAAVLVLHDVNLAARFCDHLLLLFGDGRTLQGIKQDILNEQTLRRLYDHFLLRIPTPAGDAYLPA